MTSPGPAVAAAAGIRKRFGATLALDGVSLAVQPGESHALVGRNGAGKSTLVGVLTGLLKPDAGEVTFDGEPAPDAAQRERWRERVACVYQRSTVIPALSVAENLFVNAYGRRRGGLISWRAMRAQARELLARWELDVDVDRPAAELTVGQRQIVEIARALRLGTRLMILDEPTAQLERAEIARLFDHIRRLQGEGVSFLYISHHLDEVYELCEAVTVLRDGRHVVTAPVEELPKDRLVRAMVGEDAVARAASELRGAEPGEVVVRVDDLTVDRACSGVSFVVRANECVGLAGLAGSGKAQVADAIVGLVRRYHGAVHVGERRLRPGRVDLAIRDGVAHVPEDRHARGFAPNLCVDENLTLSRLGSLGPAGLVSRDRRRREAEPLIRSLDIKASSGRQLVSELSGGNQQKVVMGRALATKPRALVLVSPTAGVDIAAKEAIYETIRGAQAPATLIVSDDLDELAICDRVLVMFEGRVVAELPAGWSDDELVATMEGVAR